jgi:3-hydroxyisobutyrate dehydrogenase-like beta-hydroxyacid dehydrogenase
VQTIGVISPGAMGSALLHALGRGGSRTVTTLAGRSVRTKRFAAQTDVETMPELGAVVRESDVVLSVVPPEAARSVALNVFREARKARRSTLFVDLNAIAPETARAIESEAPPRVEVVDGSISGPPPWRAGTTRIYLSGARAKEVRALSWNGVEAIVVGSEVGAASAVKMSTASVYKGSTALLAQALLAAQANGVLEHVLADLDAGAPELVAHVERRVASAAAKSGRYVHEMREIAATQAAASLTPELFDAIAEIYATFASTHLADSSPEDVPDDLKLEEVLAGLVTRTASVGG